MPNPILNFIGDSNLQKTSIISLALGAVASLVYDNSPDNNTYVPPNVITTVSTPVTNVNPDDHVFTEELRFPSYGRDPSVKWIGVPGDIDYDSESSELRWREKSNLYNQMAWNGYAKGHALHNYYLALSRFFADNPQISRFWSWDVEMNPDIMRILCAVMWTKDFSGDPDMIGVRKLWCS